MLNSPPRRSPTAPPPLRSPAAPPPDMLPWDTVGDVGQESRSWSPSRIQIRLPCRSLTGGSPSLPPTGELQNPCASSTKYLPSRKRSPASQAPPWVPSASPPRQALRGRESMGGRSLRRSVLVLDKFEKKRRMEAITTPFTCSPMEKEEEEDPTHKQSGSAKKRRIEGRTTPSQFQFTRLPMDEDATQQEQSGSAKKRGMEARPRITSQFQFTHLPREKEEEEDSSPIREPQPPLVPIWTNSVGKVYYGLTSDRLALNTYYDAYQKYNEKQARQDRLPTLKPHLTVSSINESYGPKQKEIFLNASKSILNLSAYIDDKEINRCTGIVVEWDEEKRSGVILTCACLITKKKPFNDWSDKEYASDAKVIVHLLDGSGLIGKLLYLSKHYDLAFYEVSGCMNLKTLPLESNLEYGLDLCVLARDMEMNLICKAVTVKYIAPCEHQYNHYLFINHSIPKCGSGGALANLNGGVVGMLFCMLPLTGFIPSSIILKCTELLRKFGRLARPQLGLKLRAVSFLDVSSIEFLWRSCGVNSGLIVGEVAAESVTEKSNIRAGDVILSCQGKSVSTVTQWEEILLSIGGEHLEKSNDSGLKADVEVEVFHVRRGIRRIIHLTVELSDGNEVFS